MAKDHMCVSLVPLFNHLDETDQRVIHMLVTHHIKEKGELIFTPTSDDQLVIVARGSLKVYQLSANGKEQVLRVIEPGGYEGEKQLFGVRNELLFGEALEKTEVCVLKQRDFTQLLLDYPQLSLKLLEINAQKMLKVSTGSSKSCRIRSSCAAYENEGAGVVFRNHTRNSFKKIKTL